MKKILFALAFLVAAVGGAFAGDKVTHDESVLPQGAQTTIKNNFDSRISMIKVDKEFGRIHEFDVILTDGTEITFDSKGNWKEIERDNRKSVPASFIPQGVRDYVKKNQSSTHIVGIEKERSGYEVKLSNGLDLKFNKEGQFLKYD